VRRRAAVVLGLALFAVLTGAMLALSPAVAATPTPTTPAVDAEVTPSGTESPAPAGEQGIRVRVLNAGADVAGVDITVILDGEEVESGESLDSGFLELPVTEPGAYTVTIDPETLPDGLTAQRESIELAVQLGGFRPAIFPLTGGDDAGAGAGGPNRFLQLSAQGLRFGLITALAAIGLSVIFGTTGLTNFAHGELVTFGAFSGLVLNVGLGIPLLVAAPIAVVVSGLFGLLNDLALWQPLRRRGTGLVAMMIVSIGLAIVLRYSFLFFFGGQVQPYDDYQAQAGLDLGPITLRPADLVSMALATVVLLLVSVALLRTRLGKATRAVADNPALAAATGINVDAVIRVVWVAGAALAGLAGILLSLAQGGSQFEMGFQILLLVFAAVTLGGLGTAFGALFGSLVVGIFIEVSTVWVPAELKNVGALAILIIILLVRPQGILGRAERVG